MMGSLQLVNPRGIGIRVSADSGLQNLAADITQQLTLGAQKPFKQVIDVSTGDPQKAGMKPLSFVRQVLAVCVYPELLKDDHLPLDVRRRAQSLLEFCGGSVGSYTSCSGMPQIKQHIAEFIMRRDGGVPSNSDDILISTGSQWALMFIMKLLGSAEGDTPTGVLIPTPCPYILLPLLEQVGIVEVPYQLAEEHGWALDLDELHQVLRTARGRCKPMAMYISNPGVPTGHVQDRKSIEEVIRFAAAESLLLLVDEVSQDSLHGQGADFVSYKRVLFEMGKEFSDTVELISFHCLSSACMGECGLRAGYMEMVNIDSTMKPFLDMMHFAYISTPVMGQLGLDIMVNPPRPGDPSYDTYIQERLLTRTTMSQNAQRAQEFLNDLPGMSCQPITAGIYLYPRLHLPSEIIQQAKEQELEADVFYCQRLLQEEGVFAGAGGRDGKHHLRLCILVPPDTLEDVLARLGSFHRRLLFGSSSP